jgi:hypothetical protein
MTAPVPSTFGTKVTYKQYAALPDMAGLAGRWTDRLVLATPTSTTMMLSGYGPLLLHCAIVG